jgi:hypothetical protein
MIEMKNRIFGAFCLCVACCLIGCKPVEPVKPKVLDLTFTQGSVICYGQYYEGLPQNVVALDLYSKDITFDSLGHIVGTGTNLYVSDIFLPLGDTIPQNGTYQCDTTGAENTFLPGMDFDGNPTGTYILDLEDSQLTRVILCSDSSFLFTRAGDSINIEFNLIGNKQPYSAHFHGVLKYEDRRQHL